MTVFVSFTLEKWGLYIGGALGLRLIVPFVSYMYVFPRVKMEVEVAIYLWKPGEPHTGEELGLYSSPAIVATHALLVH